MKLRMFGIAAMGVALFGGSAAMAQTFTVNDFETDLTGVGSNPANAIDTPGTQDAFGAVSGTKAFLFNLTSQANGHEVWDLGTLTAGSAGEQLREYNAINAASLALAGQPANSMKFIYDLTYDASNLPTAEKGFFQQGPQINSDAGSGANQGGFQNNLAFGDGLGFDMGPGGTNPGLGAASTAAGATLVDLQLAATGIASNSIKGSLEITYNVSSNTNAGKVHLHSGGTSFAQLGMADNGNWGRGPLVTNDPDVGPVPSFFDGVKMSWDNVRFVLVPEPASLGLLGLLVPAFMRRSRR